jgi:hypothetical protein
VGEGAGSAKEGRQKKPSIFSIFFVRKEEGAAYTAAGFLIGCHLTGRIRQVDEAAHSTTKGI